MPRANGRNAWAQPARRRGGSHWERRPARRHAQPSAGLDDPAWAPQPPAASEADEVEGNAASEAEEVGNAAMRMEVMMTRAAIWHALLLTRARRLWGNYQEELERERLEAPELREKVITLYAGQTSTYRQRAVDVDTPHRAVPMRNGPSL